jgi:hypothetical protein
LVTDSRSANPDIHLSQAARAQIALIAGIVIIATLAGPFGSFGLPLGTRFLLWSSLIGINTAKWSLWATQVLPRFTGKQQLAMVGVGALVLNVTVGWEVEVVYAAVGRPVDLPVFTIWVIAATISLTIGAVIWATGRDGISEQPPLAAAPASLAPGSLLARKARLNSLTDLYAVEAEDHYVRLYLPDRRRPLILYQFGDALAELAQIDGLQVHRSVWVAERAIVAARREGRNWRLEIIDGVRLPVGPSFLSAVRARGWLARDRTQRLNGMDIANGA